MEGESPAATRLPRHRSGPWWVLATALLAAAVACLVLGIHTHGRSLAPPAGAQLPPPPAAAKDAAAPAATVARSTPVALGIPALGLQVSLSTLGLNPDGTVQVPTDIQQPGWYRLGPSPGQVGSAVILGHVDSYVGPGVFFKLSTLVAGDRVDVALADGLTATFAVDTVVSYPKTQFPTLLVYGSHGYPALQLVTCGGTFDPQSGHYLSNVVVYTSLLAIGGAGQAPSTLASAGAPAVGG